MERKSLRKAQGGFTLIEIIAVLVILGILAAVAIPRFVNLQQQARVSTAEGIAAGYVSGISLAYAQSLVSGNTGATTAITAGCLVDADVVATHEGPYTVTCTAANLDTDITVTVAWDDGDLVGTPATGTIVATNLTLVWRTPEN